MNKQETKKPFVPRDKPKSWVCFILSGLIGLLLAGPIMIVGKIYKIVLLEKFGYLAFISCWTIGAIMFVIFAGFSIAGHYKSIEEKDWEDQIW